MGRENKLRVGFVVKMKQGDLLQALKEHGWSQSEAARFLGIAPSTFGKLINLQWVPKEFSPELSQGLFELTGKFPEELFPEFMRQKEFLEADKVRELYAEVGQEVLEDHGLLRLPPSPEEVVLELEQGMILEDMLQKLKPRLAQVLRGIYFEGKTKTEIAGELGVKRTRIYQLEARALMLLRHPKIRRKLLLG